MSTSTLDPQRWQRLSHLFEKAVALAPEPQSLWLDRLAASEPELIAVLRSMLEADRCSDRRRRPPPPTFQFEGEWRAGTRIGAWLIERRLGEGGMGDVYLARRVDGQVQQRVAIKRLKPGLAHPELVRRFLAERRFLARLQHPNIARFLDAGTDVDGQPYAVMEYVEGEPIDVHCRRQALGVEAVLRLFLEVVDAIIHAHAQLVVHRDIKPGNVLVDAQGRPRLLDFGIAKALAPGAGASDDTAFELRAFSLQHAAPEQLLPGPVGTSCDIHALGALLYHLLCGRPPLQLDGLQRAEAERRVLDQVPETPSSVLARSPDSALRARAKRLRGDLDRILLHALAKQPVDRYPTAEALGADLRRVLAFAPISLRSSARSYRIGRFLRRHRGSVGAAMLLAATLVVASVFSLQQARSRALERDRALLAQQQSELLSRLLIESFEAADPSRQGGQRLSAGEVLQLASRRLQASTELDARAAIELESRLVEVLLSVGEVEQAAVVAARSLERATELHAAAHAALALLSNAAVAVARSDATEASRALARLRADGLMGARHTLLGDRPEELEVQVEVLLGQQQRALQLALALHQRSLQREGAAGDARLRHGVLALERMLAVRDLDSAEVLSRELLAAIPQPEALPVGRRLLGARARLLRERGELQAAEQTQRRYLQSTAQLFGEQHRAYAGALNSAGLAAQALGRLDVAEADFRAALALLPEANDGRPDPARAMVLNNLVGLLLDGARAPEEAVRLAREAVQLATHQMRESHPNQVFLRLTLGRAEQAAGDLPAALRSFEDALTLADALPDQPNPANLQIEARLLLARVRIAEGRAELARPLLQQARQRIDQAGSEPPAALRSLAETLAATLPNPAVKH